MALVCLFIFRSKLNQYFVQAANDVRVEVGEEEYVMGPGPGIPDNPYFGVQTTNGVRTYSANSNTTTFFGPDLNAQTSEGIALSKGDSGNFDECGAWLQSVYKLDDNNWIGWGQKLFWHFFSSSISAEKRLKYLRTIKSSEPTS